MKMPVRLKSILLLILWFLLGYIAIGQFFDLLRWMLDAQSLFPHIPILGFYQFVIFGFGSIRSEWGIITILASVIVNTFPIILWIVISLFIGGFIETKLNKTP